MDKWQIDFNCDDIVMVRKARRISRCAVDAIVAKCADRVETVGGHVETAPTSVAEEYR